MENRNVYKGHRYVPKIMGVWDKLKTYEGLSIVTWEGNSYTSKKRVPEGVEITDVEYWVVTGNYDAQVENYRQDVKDYKQETDNIVTQFTQTVHSFDNVLDMKKQDNLEVGQVIRTSGYYEPNDFGGGYYRVVEPNTYEGIQGFYHNLNNGKQVELIHNDKINIHQLGAKGDGTTDDTEAFHLGLKENMTLETENKTYAVFGNFFMKDNLIWISKNTKLKLLTNLEDPAFQVISTDDVNGWSIYGELELIGDKHEWLNAYGHLSNTEQQEFTASAGVRLRNSKNFYIESLIIRNMNGSGFANSVRNRLNEDDYCSGRIDKLELLGNRLYNANFSAVNNVHVGLLIAKDAGRNGLYTHYPKAGLHMEMDFENCRLWNFRVDTLETGNNENTGISYYGGNIKDTILKRNIEISIGVHKDVSSGIPFRLSGDRLENSTFDGYVNIERAEYTQNNNEPVVVFDKWGNWLPHITFDNLRVNWLGTDEDNSIGIVDSSRMGNAGHNTGNYTIKNAEFLSGSVKPKFAFNLSAEAWTLKNIHIINPIKLDVQNYFKTHAGAYHEHIHIKDKNEVMVRHDGSDIDNNNYFSKVTNRDSETHAVISFRPPRGFECEIVVLNEIGLTVRPTGGGYDFFLPRLYRENGEPYFLTSHTVGSRLKIKRINGYFMITEMIGDWEYIPGYLD